VSRLKDGLKSVLARDAVVDESFLDESHLKG
jgi:hypothetical protein